MSDTIPGPEWDLGEVLAERKQPVTTVDILLNEAASYAKAELLSAHANVTGDTAKDKEKLAGIEKTIAETNELLEKSKYIVHLTGVPSRLREDISSKAQSKFPIQRNIMGQEDYAVQLERMKYENNLVWLAQITNVINPAGASKKTWTEETMGEFIKALPTKAQQTVDEAIRDLTEKSEQYTVASKNVDF